MDTLEERWFYKLPEGKKGPLTPDALRELFVTGVLSRETHVWRAGMESWTPALEAGGLLPQGFVFPDRTQPGSAPPARRYAATAILLAALVAGGLFVVFRSPRHAERPPETLHERLIAAGRSADMRSLPMVIDAFADADASVAAKAVTVAEHILGVRYSQKDRADPRGLAEKVQADWVAAQEQIRRRAESTTEVHP